MLYVQTFKVDPIYKELLEKGTITFYKVKLLDEKLKHVYCTEDIKAGRFSYVNNKPYLVKVIKTQDANWNVHYSQFIWNHEYYLYSEVLELQERLKFEGISYRLDSPYNVITITLIPNPTTECELPITEVIIEENNKKSFFQKMFGL